MNSINVGYTGQRRSRTSGNYLLGNGYRGFNPVIKRFTSQDSLSPFGDGGQHGLAYCGDNPVNHSDISGHGLILDFLLAALESRRQIKRAMKLGNKSIIAKTIESNIASVKEAAFAAELEVELTENGSINKISIPSLSRELNNEGVQSLMNSLVSITSKLLSSSEHHITLASTVTEGEFLAGLRRMTIDGPLISYEFTGTVEFEREGAVVKYITVSEGPIKRQIALGSSDGKGSLNTLLSKRLKKLAFSENKSAHMRSRATTGSSSKKKSKTVKDVMNTRR